MKNPIIHACAAALYIVFIVFLIDATSSLSQPKETILIPIAMLGLLVLSVAVMGFLFFFEPFRLYIDNHRQEAVLFFAKTIGIFAGFVVLFGLAVLFL